MTILLGVLTIIIGIAGIATILIALIAVSALWKGFVLAILWKWFMVPIFGLPELSLVAAIGVGLIISFLTYHQYNESGGTKLAKSLAVLILYPAIVLLFGWIVHLFM